MWLFFSKIFTQNFKILVKQQLILQDLAKLRKGKKKISQNGKKWVSRLMDNTMKFSFWLSVIYHVKSDCLFTNYKKQNSKIPSESEEIISFFFLFF